MKTKFFYFVAIMVGMMYCTAANAQDDKQMLKEQKAIQKQATKDAKTQAKALKKDGWKVAVGSKPMEAQLTDLFMKERGGKAGLPQHIVGRSEAVSGSYAAARRGTDHPADPRRYRRRQTHLYGYSLPQRVHRRVQLPRALRIRFRAGDGKVCRAVDPAGETIITYLAVQCPSGAHVLIMRSFLRAHYLCSPTGLVKPDYTFYASSLLLIFLYMYTSSPSLRIREP